MSRPRVDLLSTSELDALQRKYRSMEHANQARHGPNDRTPVNPLTQSTNQNTLRMQRAQIDKLKKDHERIKEELALETRQAKLSNNMSATQSIAKLQDQSDIYQRKIEIEKRAIANLNASIKQMDASILNSRKASGGVNAARDRHISANKSIRILENRLDKALVKFNEALAHNKQLRETIDNLRRERVVFDGIYRKLERELGEKKEKMATIIDISHAAYEARGAAQSEMYALKANADSQQNRFEREWASLGELIDKDAEMKALLAAREAERSLALTNGQDTKHHTGSSLAVVDPAVEEDSRLRSKVKREQVAIRKDRETILASQSRVLSYESSFAAIQASTGIADIEQLVQVFVAAEDENFKLFNYVNSLNAELERAESAIDALKARVAVYSAADDSHQGGEAQRKLILSTLQQQYNNTQDATQEYDKQAQLMQQQAESIKQSISELATTLGCPLGEGDDSNVADSLASIEATANQLVQMYLDTQAIKQKSINQSTNDVDEDDENFEDDENADDSHNDHSEDQTNDQDEQDQDEQDQEQDHEDDRSQAEVDADTEADIDNAIAAQIARENQAMEQLSSRSKARSDNGQEEEKQQEE